MDCEICGQARSAIQMRHCNDCEKDMCNQCIDGHDCQIQQTIDDFIESLSNPLATALAPFGYWLTEESTTDTQIVFEFTSSEAPRIEVRIDKDMKHDD